VHHLGVAAQPTLCGRLPRSAIDDGRAICSFGKADRLKRYLRGEERGDPPV
jgi:hypothetical protein